VPRVARAGVSRHVFVMPASSPLERPGLARFLWLALPGGVRSVLRRPGSWQEFFWFGLKQAWACIFGALLLLGLVATRWAYPETGWWGLSRYDFLFFYALAIQGLLLLLRMETWREAGVVVLYHLLATAMELFKTSEAIGSWAYPEEASIRLGGVPLFAGFLYSAVGSYIARAWRIFDLRFERFPPVWIAAALALLAYLNFFSHHYLPDLRWALIAGVGVAYARTTVLFTPTSRSRRMPLLLGFGLVTAFLWIAENLGTLTATWIYPHQSGAWRIVGWGKATSWFLLMQLSFVLVYLLRGLEGGRVRGIRGIARDSALMPVGRGESLRNEDAPST